MKLDSSGDRLVYLQLADFIEDSILMDAFPEGTQIPSVAELSVNFQMNHITALKGVGVLADAGILIKKRGVGMFVAEGAKEIIRKERVSNFQDKYVRTVVEEAKKLGITKEDFAAIMCKAYEMGGNNNE